MTKQRVIMLADMQSFYASCEKIGRPEWRDKPLVVGGDPQRRAGIVLAACPVAKRYGITTGEWLGTAKQKCPDLIIQPARMQYYLDLSMYITRILYKYSDLVEPYSVDEQWIDVTGSLGLFGSPEHIAKQIQDEIMSSMNIWARIGISYAKIPAKIACDLIAKKAPSGLCYLPDRAAYQAAVWPHFIGDMWMVGSRMSRHLLRMNIQTIGDLAALPVTRLKQIWGVNGEVLWRIAQGIDESPVAPATFERKQVTYGNGMTLPRDYYLREDIEAVLLELAEITCRRCREDNVMGKTISVYVQGADFDRPSGFSRQATLNDPSNATAHIYAAAKALFERHWNRQPVRKVGLAVSQLQSEEQYQLAIGDTREAFRQLERATDEIKDRYGEDAILRAVSLTEAGQARRRARLIGGHGK